MSALLFTVLALFVCTLLVGGFLYSGLRKVKAEYSTHNEPLRSSLDELDSALTNSQAHLKEMVDLTDYVRYQEEIAELESANANLVAESQALEIEVQERRGEIERKERQQEVMRNRQQDSLNKADEIQARKDELETEFIRLKAEVDQSINQMKSLTGEVELKGEQKQSVEQISSALEAGTRQLEALKVDYDASCERFLTLQNQYAELEKEYSRLIAAELSQGKPVRI